MCSACVSALTAAWLLLRCWIPRYRWELCHACSLCHLLVHFQFCFCAFCACSVQLATAGAAIDTHLSSFAESDAVHVHFLSAMWTGIVPVPGLQVYFTDTMKFFLALYGHKLPVLSMDISSDGALLASGSADKNLKIWGLDFGDCHRSIFAHADSVMQAGPCCN